MQPDVVLRPTQHLRMVQADFPHLGQTVDLMRAERGEIIPTIHPVE